ncbi:cysteine hydrolase [Sporolactobacillus shoreicorticis]|uniref:Cysteine hydrolase family protein n=1 Tax=Sporolactobacillus shoreicorticis TaxID=1923877 RepID=A0ABW5S8F8_9BACL|nr:cysteine hydrolase [Sporolactobacillus shoreicorticis]MCO7125463.1 cysteine hydrolase [Sporolactobacillus shoreicorticis]
MNLEDSVNPKDTAFLIIDMQNDYCHKEGSMAKQGLDVASIADMLPSLSDTIEKARSHQVPIIFIRTIHEKSTDSKTWMNRMKGVGQHNLCRKGTWGSEFFKLSPMDEDTIITKHRYSAFINTKLDSVLHTLEIKNLLVAGVSTNVCVESTARDGFMLDYNIVFLSDCTAAFSEEAHQSALANISQFFGTVARSGQVLDCWESIKINDISIASK